MSNFITEQSLSMWKSKRFYFAKLHALSNILPRSANYFTQIYPWHFATMSEIKTYDLKSFVVQWFRAVSAIFSLQNLFMDYGVIYGVIFSGCFICGQKINISQLNGVTAWVGNVCSAFRFKSQIKIIISIYLNGKTWYFWVLDNMLVNQGAICVF